MRDLLIIAIVFGSVPFTLRRPYIGAVMWAWISFMNPHRLTWGMAYDMPFAQVIAAATLIGLVLTPDEKSLPRGLIVKIWMAFVVWTAVTTFFALDPPEAAEQFQRMIKIQIMAFVTIMLIRTRKQLMAYVIVVAVSLGFYGVKSGIFTFAGGGNFRVWGPPGSFIEGNNEMGLALCMVLPLINYLRQQSTNRWVRWALLAVMPLTGLSILGTQSRGALVAGTAMVLVLWWKSRRKVISGVVLSVVVVSMVTFMPSHWFQRMETIKTYDEDASAMGRINAWMFAYHLANDRPILGGGFGAFSRDLFRKYAPAPEDVHDAHSIYFEVLAEQGYVGLALFLGLGVAAFRNATWILRRTREHPREQWAYQLAAMCQVGMVGYAVGGAFLGLAYFDLYYALIGIVLITRRILVTEDLSGAAEAVPGRASGGARNAADAAPVLGPRTTASIAGFAPSTNLHC